MASHGNYRPDMAPDAKVGCHVSWLRKFGNFLGCLLAFPIYWQMTARCRYPVTLDLVLTIALAELNRFLNEGRRLQFYQQDATVSEKVAPEKIDMEQQETTANLDCVAAVVGWREDPALFARALQSYKRASNCVFLLVGVDGDELPDQDMVGVFENIYPEHSQIIQLSEPLGEVAERLMAKLMAGQTDSTKKPSESQCHQMVVQHCIELAKAIIEQKKVIFHGSGRTRQLCIQQRHMHKKGIMFTTFIFSLVVADILGVEFLWSSDSDTIVLPDSLKRTIDCIAAKSTIGGASSGLVIHNEDETVIARLAASVYWGELYLTRSSTAAPATSDCQSGPSSVFRLAALPPILIPWYLQTVFGKRMIINEDRHLTTNLLSRGWGVVFASDVLAATDTPTNLGRWIKQQVRWARATHVEAILHPRVYVMNHPLLFYGMAKREIGPLIAATAVLYYLFTAKQLISISFLDLAFRSLLGVVYNLFRNPQRLDTRALLWIFPGMIFYHIPLPAIHVWSMLTLTADGWGTSMRASTELLGKESKRKSLWETGFFVLWMGAVAGTLARYVAGNLRADWEHTMISMMLVSFAASLSTWKIIIRYD
ncbi:hypothetical protein G7046_g1868 [Stylonectria norvegica]|nr:hypothetical protein G7046_g1868 [Stylonectria norvegica]